MAEQFKPGDLVRVKSGGPVMTVANTGTSIGEQRVWCEWFDQKNQPQKGAFSPDTLIGVEENKEDQGPAIVPPKRRVYRS